MRESRGETVQRSTYPRLSHSLPNFLSIPARPPIDHVFAMVSFHCYTCWRESTRWSWLKFSNSFQIAPISPLGFWVWKHAIVSSDMTVPICAVEALPAYLFGEGLELVEQQWLVQEINAHVEALGSSVDVDSLPPPDAPAVFNDEPGATS
eukprot:1141827-Pelagomonas_calceolata.AAC.1